MTVSELRAFLNTCPDDAPITVPSNDVRGATERATVVAWQNMEVWIA